MRHLDPDRLALVALGERLDGEDEQELTSHLAGCPDCQREVRALRHTAQLAREAGADRDEEDRLRPGESVWTGIVAELGLADPPAPRAEPAPGTGRRPAPHPDWFQSGRRPGPPAGPPAGPPVPWPGPAAPWPGPPPAQPHPWPAPAPAHPDPRSGTAGRRQRRWVRGAVALAAAAAIGVLGTLAAVRPWQDRGTGTPPAASPTAELAPVPGGPGGVSGRALVVRGAAGPELRLTTAGLPALNQGYYEVWVFDGGKNMVAVGVLGPGPTATLPLPPTLDLRTFAIVDISQEKYDGVQTHSETSVLRGTLSE